MKQIKLSDHFSYQRLLRFVFGRSVELWDGGRENANSTSKEQGMYATGFGLYKFFKEGKGSLAGNFLQWPYLRLAEVYLIYAEALLKTGNLPKAIEQLDIVRLHNLVLITNLHY